MAGKTVTKRRIDADRFKRFIRDCGFTNAGDFANYCSISERSVRSIFANGEAPITLCYDIAIAFGRSFDDIFGPDNSEEMVLWRMCLAV